MIILQLYDRGQVYPLEALTKVIEPYSLQNTVPIK